ncbi:group II intron reverse transcriptase/maturase [Portibacter lacus]|uniref:group II intron reverse transcriptase/maturase n=1 Tax=Portibacter lacus TaxID=1099794 RepID=UPI001F2BBF7E|nr:group II intron reverse transcriptase/maturase [Portibacter lacus]
MKYTNLMDSILSRANLIKAYEQVVSNKGSAGVDGMRVDELKDYLTEHLASLIDVLRNGTYVPQPVLGVKIPKGNGGVRQLGIPTVVDRMIQQAIHQVLSQLWEPMFSQHSYGFRPGRNAHQALAQATEYINAGYQDIIDLDLKSFFDIVNHDKLMGLLRKKIEDPILLRLIRKYLRAGIVDDGSCSKRTMGTPQGGPISPLLSNILLTELDNELTLRGIRFVRYADDCSMFLKSKKSAHRVLRNIKSFLETKLKLQVNEEKTSVCRPVKFELLGYCFTSTYKKGEKGKYRLSIAKKSWKKLKEKIKLITKKMSPIPFKERIQRLNWLMWGWVNYFKYGTGYAKFKSLDSWVRCRLRYCIWKGWKNPKRRYRAFRQLGLFHSKARQFSYSRLGGWRISCSPIMGTTVTEQKLQLRGYQSFSNYYHTVKNK